jgi:hypothetical protein
MSIRMALIHYDATTDTSGNSLRGTLRRRFIQHRLALLLFSGAVVASGVAVNWNWITAAGLLPILAFLPCMLMMFMCMKHGARGPDEETALQRGASPSRLSASSDSQQ